MLANVRVVFVIQLKNSGLFLNSDCHPVRSLRLAGRAPDYDNAVETARWEFPGEEVEIHRIVELVE